MKLQDFTDKQIGTLRDYYHGLWPQVREFSPDYPRAIEFTRFFLSWKCAESFERLATIFGGVGPLHDAELAAKCKQMALQHRAGLNN